jgi:hypothetical protein
MAVVVLLLREQVQHLGKVFNVKPPSRIGPKTTEPYRSSPALALVRQKSSVPTG